MTLKWLKVWAFGIGMALSATVLSCSDMYDNENISDPQFSDAKNNSLFVGRYEGRWIVNRQSAEKAEAKLDSVLVLSRLPQKEILREVTGKNDQNETSDNTVFTNCQLSPVIVGYSESSTYFNFQPQSLEFSTTMEGRNYAVILYMDLEASAMVYDQARGSIAVTIKINHVDLVEKSGTETARKMTFDKEIVITFSGNKK